MTGYSSPRPIREDDDVAGFASGEPSLDTYLHTRALANHREGASRCFVACRERVVGYYALAAASIQRVSAPGRLRRNMPAQLPVILLSRLAVDRTEQGKGLGQSLLRDAINRSVRAADLIGVRAILVHAAGEQARSFYTHFDFEPSVTDPMHLMLSIKDARAVLGVAGR